MSIPRPKDAPAPAVPDEDAANTALIQQLATEFFKGGQESPPVTLPTTVVGVPAQTPLLPSSGPATTTTADTRDISLNGGFPGTSSSAPPVHPTLVNPEPDAKEETPTGTHNFGTTDSYEFGEPRYYFDDFQARRSTTPTSKDLDGRPPEGSSPSAAAPTEEPSFYFLDGLKTGGFQNPVASPTTKFDVEGVRRDFPALHQRVNGHPLIWLDNAATTQKPQAVLDATSQFYGRDNSNIHRAAHVLADRSTKLFEASREKVRQFLGAADAKEIVFVRGTTEAINLVAQSYGKQHITPGDEIVLSGLEHHANIVPWQLLAQQTGATIRVIPLNDRGELMIEELPALLNKRTKIVSVAHVSNSLGTVTPIQEIIGMAHAQGIPVLVDGAQSTPHMPINVTALDADFFVFSGHKIFGPTGIGALYGKAHLLEAMPPWQGGGHMIKDVTFEKTVYQHAPEKFEAGTPDIAGVVGLGAAIDYLTRTGLPAIAAYEHALLDYATQALATVPGVRPIGTAFNKASVFGFVIPGVPNEKIAKHLDQHGIAVRAGHHCALPALRHFGVESTVRPSLAFYNTYEEVDALIRVLHSLPRR